MPLKSIVFGKHWYLLTMALLHKCSGTTVWSEFGGMLILNLTVRIPNLGLN